jgi:DNA (cytosine-5)-methyltransferase 1
MARKPDLNKDPHEGGAMLVLDLFCGAGGTSLGLVQGLQLLGLHCDIVGVDIDSDSCATFQRNNVGHAVRADVAFLPLRRLTGVFDVVIGCPPCQGFSRMRRGCRIDDPRNSLVLTFIEWIKELRPTSILFENVARISETKYREKLENALQRLGYRFVDDVLDAADFGVPQRRKRFVLVASLVRPPVLPEPIRASPEKAGKLGKKAWLTVREAIADLPALTSGTCCRMISLHEARTHTESVLQRIRTIPKNGGSRSSLPVELQLRCHLKRREYNDVYGRMRWDTVAPTLTSGCTNPTKGRFVHPEQDREITAREAARLQTFPDCFIFHGTAEARARQIGNAMPPVLVQEIAKKLLGSP